ncbi:MAG: elongation factor P [Candidatus Methylumidiphilus sp.]
MGFVNTSEFKNGMKLMLDGEPVVLLENEFVKPGKGQAFNRVKFRFLKTGRVLERTLKSGETMETADVADTDLKYLYNDAEGWHFMDETSYEQYAVDPETVGEARKWLREQDVCMVTFYNGQPLIITPPNSVILKIVETDPGVRGDTSGGGGKPAKLETGAVVRVPLFVQQDELIKVDTRTGEYLSRAKE